MALKKFFRSKSGGFAVQASLFAIPLLMSVGMAVDYSRMLNAKNELQQAADAAALHSLKTNPADAQDRTDKARTFFMGSSRTAGSMGDFQFNTEMLSANRVRVTVAGSLPPMFMQLGGYPKLDVAVVSEAENASAAASAACVTILANQPQALLLNSGASIAAPNCEMHVHARANPAFIHNAAVNLDMARLCVKGTRYINNGAPITELEDDCDVADDPYENEFAEPALPSNCTSSGALNSGNHVLDPGMHCGTIFNGVVTVTFRPGLHIIRDRMILNAGSTIIAEGVTFYFPNTDSEIRANGGLTFTGIAPKTGPYQGILMFEKTSNAANNAQKRQYVFNGSVGEKLEGIIYLPNRDVTYNSTTNVSASKINLVANTMIVNSANWALEAYEGGSSGGESGPKLVN